jgi:hypothetical protein
LIVVVVVVAVVVAVVVDVVVKVMSGGRSASDVADYQPLNAELGPCYAFWESTVALDRPIDVNIPYLAKLTNTIRKASNESRIPNQ